MAATQKHPPPGNGKSTTVSPADVDRICNQWPAIDSVAKLLHLPFGRVQDFVRDGHLTTVRVRGQTRFNPDEVEKLAASLSEIPSEDELEDRKASRAGMPAEAVRATAELVRQMGDQVAEMHRLCMDLHRLNMDSWSAANSAQDRAFTRLLDRCSKYEKVIDDYLDAREQQFSLAMFRDMAKRDNEAKIERRSQMWVTTKEQLTRLVDIAVQRFSLGMDQGSVKKMQLAAGLFKSLSRTHLNLLLEQEGFLDDKQKELLRELLKMEDEELKARANARDESAQTPPAQEEAAPADKESTSAEPTAQSPPTPESATTQESE